MKAEGRERPVLICYVALMLSRWRRSSVFTPNDFLDLGGRDAVDKALSRLATRAEVRRLARGLYEYPREHRELGTLSPDFEKVAKALAGKDRIRLQPAGAYATNLWDSPNKCRRRQCS